jgi:hypothetical protein
MPTRQRERRTFEVRAVGAEDAAQPTRIEGYAAVFNQIEYGEMIAPGAFTKTLQEQPDIRMYWTHEMSQPLARTSNGTLELRQDDHGLHVVGFPNPETSWGRDALASVARGDVNQMSFGFAPIREGMDEVNGERVRVLQELRLYEVSPVADPWYSGTSAEARQKGDGSAANEPEPGSAHPTRDAHTPRLLSQLMDVRTRTDRMKGYLE